MRPETILQRKNPRKRGHYTIRDFNNRVYNSKTGRRDGKLLYTTLRFGEVLDQLVVARKNAGNKRVYCFVENPKIMGYCCRDCGMERPDVSTLCHCCCTFCNAEYSVDRFHYRKRIKDFEQKMK